MEVYDEYALDELIHRYMEGEIDFYKIVEFCDDLEPNLKNMKMLTDCIDCYDIEILYETLFQNFDELLSAEELKKYKDRYMNTFDSAV